MKVKFSMLPPVGGPRNNYMYRDRREKSGYQGWLGIRAFQDSFLGGAFIMYTASEGEVTTGA